MPYVMRVGEEINFNRLEDTIRKIIYRHDSFRTSILMIDKEPVQRIHDKIKFEIEYYYKTEISDTIRDFVRRRYPFSLS